LLLVLLLLVCILRVVDYFCNRMEKIKKLIFCH